MEERGKQVSKVSSQLLGKKGAIYSLPPKTSRWSSAGPEFPGLSTGAYTGTSGATKNSGVNLRSKVPDPHPREKRKRLSQIFLGPDIPDQGLEFPDHGNFRGKILEPLQREMPKRLSQKAQMKIWAGTSGAWAGTSGGPEFPA